jgi:hypothetical protein
LHAQGKRIPTVVWSPSINTEPFERFLQVRGLFHYRNLYREKFCAIIFEVDNYELLPIIVEIGEGKRSETHDDGEG